MWTRSWRPRRHSRGSRILAALVALLGGTAASPCTAQTAEVPVDLELVIAVDVSGSIDVEEARLQRDGYVGAFANADVIGAITGGMLGRIAVTYIEWAGARHSRTVIDWTLLDGPASARAFSAALADSPIETELWTSISHAIDVSIPKFGQNRFAGARKVIDISGDGPNNQGGLVTHFRDRAVAAGITINGLPVMLKRAYTGSMDIENLDEYYEDCVIGGPGAFVVVAETYEAFGEAILRKLVTEIADLRPSPCRRNAQATAGLEIASLVGRTDRLGRPASAKASASHPLGIEAGLEAGAIALQRALGTRSVGTLENPVLPCR